ncbi:T9SS type A sorting domain-containing protein [Cytophaga aurantiaca]|uniref:T9SS type A sorting domain-containing protein n=1 Tax=Cytophaga aurantiaca TaxID=29530 RepID=UPI000377EB8D|nr:T9SS type A sorting domain-containing protein [Cytophaga aurantiaca]
MKKILLAVIIFVSAITASYSQCTPPTSVTIVPSVSICVGANLILTGIVTLPTTPPTGVYQYTWYKGTYSAANIVAGPSESSEIYWDFIKIGVALADAGTYTLRVEDYTAPGDNASCYKEASVVVTVNPIVQPSVTLSADKTAICNGDVIKFTATPTNGGTNPPYQWKKNGITIAGATNATYTTTSAQNGDSYTVTLTSVDACANPTTVTSNAIIITVTPTVLPSVTISVSPNTTICAGTSVTFTATPTNGGTTPFYQWNKNGVNIYGATNATYTTTSVQNGDSYTVRMTSYATCPSPSTATSYAIVMTVATVLTPAVSITATPAGTICPGTSVTFTASPGNGGTAPMYEWFIGGTSQGVTTSAETFTSTTLANGDQVKVVMTSSSGCVAAPGTATSNTITTTVTQAATPTVSISADKSAICRNGSVTFTATPGNGGVVPLYEWFINNVSQGGANSPSTFTTSALTSSSDVVKVILTSSVACASAPGTASATKSITINTGIDAGIIGSDQTICYNTIPAKIIEITAPENITGTATYEWEASLDGISTWVSIPGASGATYTPTVSITYDVFIRRVTIDSGTPAPCNVATSNTVHITVRPQLTAGVISSDETLCSGSIPSAITQTAAPAGGDGTFTYLWQAKTSGAFSIIAGETNATYTPSTLTVTTQFQRVETSGACGSVTSNAVTKTVSNAPATIHIEDPGQTCNGDIVVFKSKATNAGLTPTYNWYVNDVLIASTLSGFTTPPFEGFKSGDEVYAEVLSSNTCATTSPAISNKITVDLIPCTISNSIYTTTNIDVLLQNYTSNSIPSVTDYTYLWWITHETFIAFVITGPNPITPGQQSATYSVPDQTDITYQWSVTGGTIVSGQNTNSVTVDWDNAVSSATARTTSIEYSISVTETNQANQSKTATLDLTTRTTGVTKTQAQAGITLFPNPTTGSFNIEMPESGMDVSYEVLDLTGLSVASGTFTSTGSNQNIDASFGAGMYQVILKYDNVVTCVRLSKIQ